MSLLTSSCQIQIVFKSRLWEQHISRIIKQQLPVLLIGARVSTRHVLAYSYEWRKSYVTSDESVSSGRWRYCFRTKENCPPSASVKSRWQFHDYFHIGLLRSQHINIIKAESPVSINVIMPNLNRLQVKVVGTTHQQNYQAAVIGIANRGTSLYTRCFSLHLWMTKIKHY